MQPMRTLSPRVFFLASTALGLCMLPAHAEQPSGLAALKALKIDAGTMTVEHIDSPTMENAKGSPLSKLPPRTAVKTVLNPAKGSNIRVEVWLPEPEKWNGRLIGFGNGGAAGSINSASLAGWTASGYAAVSTDMGTAPNSDSGIGNPEVWKDFGYRATHLMTVHAKQVIKVYYGRDPEFSYFSGGSTGGQQSLQEAQRYPEDYDGIVANVPAHCRTPLHAYFLWNEQTLHRCPFTKSQKDNVTLACNEFAAAREAPETAGKLVSDPRCTKDDIEAVIKLARKKDATLTDAHADALRKLFEGPHHAVTGERIFNGIPLGSSFDAAHGHLYLFQWVFGKDKDLNTIDFGKDIDTYTAALAPVLNAENPDLSPFEKRGGKLLMVSGSADSVVPYHATLDYYERVIEHFGSLEKTQSFVRYYIAPGMAHGAGGPGINKMPDMLKLVMEWREKGKAPEVIKAQRVIDGKTELDLSLHPYPGQGKRGGVERVAERFRPAAKE